MDQQNKKYITIEVPENSYRTTATDYVYYSSDLSKYIGKECDKVMTSINIDLAQFKKSKKILRIAEYKHENEEMKYQQNELLKELAKAFDFLNNHNYPIKFEICIIRGNHPYSKIQIKDLLTNTTYLVEGDAVKKYLTFE